MSSQLSANHELMHRARADLSGKWGLSVGTVLVAGLIASLGGVLPIVGPLILNPPLSMGLVLFFLSISRRQPAEMDQLFNGFKKFGVSVLANLLASIFTLLWSILLIIPGIIAAYSYAMTFFIIADEDSIGPMKAIAKSKRMMKGHRWKLFCLQFRFLGWSILCLFTCGIGFLWLIPYSLVSHAHFYDEVKGRPQA